MSRTPPLPSSEVIDALMMAQPLVGGLSRDALVARPDLHLGLLVDAVTALVTECERRPTVRVTADAALWPLISRLDRDAFTMRRGIEPWDVGEVPRIRVVMECDGLRYRFDAGSMTVETIVRSAS